MADATRRRTPGNEAVAVKGKGKQPSEDASFDEDPSESDTSGSCASDEFDLNSQNDRLSEGLNAVVPSALQEHGNLSPETDTYVVTEYRSLLDAIEQWVEDAFAAMSVDDEPWRRLSALFSLQNYEKLYKSDRIRPAYLNLIQRVHETKVLPKAYVAHWIMYNINQDIFDQEYPLGLESWKGPLDVLTKRVKDATGSRSNLRYFHWFGETMFALTSIPSPSFVEEHDRKTREICAWHSDSLRQFFEYEEDNQARLEKQYGREIVWRAAALHRFMKCSIYNYHLRNVHPPHEIKPEYIPRMKFKHVDTLAVVAPVLVENVHRLPLYHSLVRLKWEAKTKDLQELKPLNPAFFFVDQKAPSG